ncbi:hypothetical protein ACFQZX_06240 [Mucilaginibacter litoreus]|uniref:Uncharacterized protein n=1 Tax=Mucilaginibacter litoreus TaxID=1048221 RepID=A0ABW3AQU9_9SPHI
MKALLLWMSIAFLPCLVMAQTPHLTPSKNTNAAEEYCIVKTHSGIFERTLCIDIDRGEGPGFDKRLRDENGSEIRFNSLADALNYMARQGWVYVNTIKDKSDEHPDFLMKRLLTSN